MYANCQTMQRFEWKYENEIIWISNLVCVYLVWTLYHKTINMLTITAYEVYHNQILKYRDELCKNWVNVMQRMKVYTWWDYVMPFFVNVMWAKVFLQLNTIRLSCVVTVLIG